MSPIPPPHTQALVLGGGPTGVEAALALDQAGLQVSLFESGAIGDSVRRWGSVRLFSPWSMNLSEHSQEFLKAQGAPLPDPDHYPTGDELVSEYLLPITESDRLRDKVFAHTHALAAARLSANKGEWIGDKRRAQTPFRVLWQQGDQEGATHCDILVDCTGVYRSPNALGSGGLPIPGEAQVTDAIVRDFSNFDPARYEGKKVAVLGAGYSAATALVQLAPQLSHGTKIHWVLRSEDAAPLPTIEDDPLPERAKLTEQCNRWAEAPPAGLTVVRGQLLSSCELLTNGMVRVGFEPARASQVPSPVSHDEFDAIIAMVGYRPDPHLLRELQVHHCWATEGLMKVSAALLGAAGGDCLAAPSPGPETIVNPEPNLFVLGTKSYGRSSQYLLRHGHEQVRHMIHALKSRS